MNLFLTLSHYAIAIASLALLIKLAMVMPYLALGFVVLAIAQSTISAFQMLRVLRPMQENQS